MNKVRILFFVLAVFFGAFLFVYGEFDDSPGGQLLGLVIALGGVWGGINPVRSRAHGKAASPTRTAGAATSNGIKSGKKK